MKKTAENSGDRKALNHLLGLTLTVAMIVSTITYISLQHAVLEPIAVTPKQLVSRQPQNVGDVQESSQTGSVSDWRWDCHSPESLTIPHSFLRLYGDCSQDDKLAIINSTNGYTASVFAISNKSFTTDYIQLAKGENILEIQRTLESGDKETLQIRVTQR